MAQQIPNRAKLYPKLRMIQNGNEIVNTLRAEQAAAVRIVSPGLLNSVGRCREPGDRPVSKQSLKRKRGKLKAPVGQALANVFIELSDGVTGQALPERIRKRCTAEKANLLTAEIPLSWLDDLTKQDVVTRVEIGEGIRFSPPLDVASVTRAPSLKYRDVGDGRMHGFGAEVLIGIIDVQGFDFSHPDFLDNQGCTRFVSIWDQGGDTRAAPVRFGFDYGAEIKASHMNNAINASTRRRDPAGLPPYLLEPQSQMSASSHATHVASIAAGNRGICRRSGIAGVLISLPDEDTDRRKSFYDSTRIAHAVDYLLKLGEELGLPVSINISLGTNGHAHDASSAVSRWIDYALAHPGRAITVAVGNAGQEAPAEPGDIGFIMGRIHTSGHIPNAHLSHNVEWVVIGDGIADLSENELELWYSPQDRFAVEVISPSGDRIGPVEPGQFIENHELPSGTFISIYDEIYAPANGDNYIAVYLSPFFSDQGVVGVEGGTWTLRVLSREVRNGHYHAWIERDDPRRLGRIGMQEAWSFPSFFTARSNVDNSSVSSLACGQRIIGVANLDAERGVINITSSQGPTRDNREKPEICAPGTDIVAANGFSGEEDWVSMTGTSMAAPYVTGVVGLMLSVEPRLTAAQITGILRRTAAPLPGHDFNWRDDAGFGSIDANTCLREAARAFEADDVTGQ